MSKKAQLLKRQAHKGHVSIIGAGPAGLIAALHIKKNAPSTKVTVIDREIFVGGILNQCIHPGFGLLEFGQELTGPEYAAKVSALCRDFEIEFLTETSVLSINKKLEVVALSPKYGAKKFQSKAIVLCTGCRERSRGALHIPGDRPSGIMTAGLAQKFINIDGLVPGSRVAILGSGDIGAIMARRLTLQGVEVAAVIEIKKSLSARPRNVIQCIVDFQIPIYLEHTITKIVGRERLEKIKVAKILSDGRADFSTEFEISCDTLLLSVGLIPENELAEMAGVALDAKSNGVIVDEKFMSSIPGIFACGNAMKIYDLVDHLSEDSKKAGESVAAYLTAPLVEGKQV
ncbi:MAG: FAD-dependent oxidoreductase [Oligoflexia bacterium]|nr:FAD-dependent oxidoreductase [Oligoflexia bacterium]MBF0366561.1 FAD-dependent oxidoreductase [Oligoflexia bacterium]